MLPPNPIQLANKFQPKDKDKMWDSLSIADYTARPDYYTITTLVQASIRFLPFKKIALYDKDLYLGNYEVQSAKEYSYSQLTDKICIMIFGKLKKDCWENLKALHQKGRFTDKAKFYFIILFQIGYNSYHVIPKRHETNIL